MEEIGFQEKGRYFVNPDTKFFVEFPDGPLSVGEEPVREISEYKMSTGILRVLSPTDCVKDRLCAFYFWNDQQGLTQAVLVAKSQSVDLKEIKKAQISPANKKSPNKPNSAQINENTL